ncbi:hypothetical protein BGX28_010384 [Mortierella sp. GBA30]|nr:hypothetical protein BGX28_010384 [Mortierella sp. GBA30]
MRTSFVLSAATALLTMSLIHTSDAQQLCNGYAELCGRTYDKIAYATTHNSYAFQHGALGANQNNDIPTQLSDGIRAFMLDAYYVPTGDTADIELCHTKCNLLDAGTLSKTLTQIKTFMDANPNEVITIFFENAENLMPEKFQMVYTSTGIDRYSYTQAAGSAIWPTLAAMISNGKRLLTFMDSGFDSNGNVPWLMGEYNFIFETPWLIHRDTPFPCTVDRPENQRKQMYMLNHFISGNVTMSGVDVEVPQPLVANVTNAANLTDHINSCQTTFNQIPNFIAVDFYEQGSVLQATAAVNRVTWNGKEPTQPVVKPKPQSIGSKYDVANALIMGMMASMMVILGHFVF